MVNISWLLQKHCKCVDHSDHLHYFVYICLVNVYKTTICSANKRWSLLDNVPLQISIKIIGLPSMARRTWWPQLTKICQVYCNFVLLQLPPCLLISTVCPFPWFFGENISHYFIITLETWCQAKLSKCLFTMLHGLGKVWFTLSRERLWSFFNNGKASHTK